MKTIHPIRGISTMQDYKVSYRKLKKPQPKKNPKIIQFSFCFTKGKLPNKKYCASSFGCETYTQESERSIGCEKKRAKRKLGFG